MPSFATMFMTAGLVALAQAQGFTKPGAQTFGAIFTPDTTNPVTRGQPFTVTWDDTKPAGLVTDATTVSLVLCIGPSNNCVVQPTAIASGIPAKAKSFVWNVPCSLAPASTGYGMLIIVDGTGEFQFSTQFGVLAGNCAASTTTSTVSTTSVSSSTTSATTSATTSTSVITTTTLSTTMYANSTTTYTSSTTGRSSSTVAPITTTTTTTGATSSPTFTGAANKLASGAAAIIAAGVALLAL